MCIRVIDLLRALPPTCCYGVALSRSNRIVRLDFALGKSFQLLLGNRPLAVVATFPRALWVHFTTRTSVVVGSMARAHSLLAKHRGAPGVRKVN